MRLKTRNSLKRVKISEFLNFICFLLIYLQRLKIKLNTGMTIKQIALDQLKKKFEGVGENILSRIAKSISKTAKTEDDVTDAVDDMTLTKIIDSYTDSRVTEASDTAIKNYETKYKLKDGKAAGEADEGGEGGNGTGNKNNSEGNEDTPAYVKALMESVKALTGEVASLKAGKTADARKATLNKLLDGVNDKVKKQIEREFSRANYKDDADFDAWIEEITPDIDDARSSAAAAGAETGKPGGSNSGGNKNNEPNAQVMARVDAMLKSQAGTASPAIKGMPTTTK